MVAGCWGHVHIHCGAALINHLWQFLMCRVFCDDHGECSGVLAKASWAMTVPPSCSGVGPSEGYANCPINGDSRVEVVAFGGPL